MSDAQFHVRQLNTEDIAPVSALARVVWQSTYPALISQAQIDAMLSDRYSTPHIRAQLEDPTHGWWVAHQNLTLVGFAHALLDPTDCKLDKLYVHPDTQAQGVGRTLLLSIQQWARRQHAGRLWLQVNRGNTQAITAYQKYGFRIIESRVFDIGDGFVMDDHLMEQRL